MVSGAGDPGPALAWARLLADQADSALLRRAAGLAEAAPWLRGGMVYLATPYTRRVIDEGGRFCPYRSEAAGSLAAEWQRRLALHGVSAFSPIAASVAMIRDDLTGRHPAPLDVRFWEAWCRPFLLAARAVVVPMVEGWEESEGVLAEVRAALESCRTVLLVGDVE